MSHYDLSAYSHVVFLLILLSLLALSALPSLLLSFLPSWPIFPSLIVLPLLLDQIFAYVFVFSFQI